MSLAVVLEDLSFAYENAPVLEGVSLEIASHQIVGIMGPNGGGKTTLLKLIMAFLRPNLGVIKVLGKTPQEARLSIGYVPQFHRVDREFPITVLELVLLGALNQMRPWAFTP